MRAISLWQPWASAVALGSKRIETRHWATTYRGPLAIHAAQRCVKSELYYYQCQWNWQGALRKLRNPPTTPEQVKYGDKDWHLILPFGAILAVCNLTDCRATDSHLAEFLDLKRIPAGEGNEIFQWTERDMGNFEPGRFAWELSNIRPLLKPIPYKGHQGFFNVPDELLSLGGSQ